jgi:hypothetical protein
MKESGIVGVEVIRKRLILERSGIVPALCGVDCFSQQGAAACFHYR